MGILDIPPPSDFLLPFLRGPALFVLGFTQPDYKANGDRVFYSESYPQREFLVRGTPKLRTTPSGVVYLDFNGTTDYLTTPDDIWNSPTTREFTVWAVTQTDDIATRQNVISKAPAGSDNAFFLDAPYDSTHSARVGVYQTDGNTVVGQSLTNTPTTNWNIVFGNFIPGTEVRAQVNANADANVASIPSAIRNSAAVLSIGAYSYGAMFMNGRVAAIGMHDGILDAADKTRLIAHCRRSGV